MAEKPHRKTSQLTLQEHALLLLLLTLLVVGSIVRYQRYRPDPQPASAGPPQETPLSKPEMKRRHAED